MGNYRNRLQIVADILVVAEDGAKKTHIMYGANLSYGLLSQYLAQVLDAGLVHIDGKGLYKLTEKGRMFLEDFNKYSKENTKVKNQIDEIENTRGKLEKILS